MVVVVAPSPPPAEARGCRECPGGAGLGGGRLGMGLSVPHGVPTLHLSGQRKVTDGNKGTIWNLKDLFFL